MRDDREAAGLHLLSWSQNGDSLDVAVVSNRLAASGRTVLRCLADAAPAEAGDYLVELRSGLAGRLQDAGIALAPWTGEPPAEAYVVRPARVAVLAGRASAYPYYGYYALALLRLGFAFEPVDGAAIAAGALDRANVAVLPGGFSNWGLDAKEGSAGADRAFRRFLESGGVAVASCGGSFYLSRGRPAWLGLADARPVFTQEYLRTGVGITTCSLAPGRALLGLPPTLEIPYFHGPVWDALGPNATPLAHFRDLYGHGRLFIDNPLREEVFERHMAGRVAALRVDGPRGRAILFSPHPEMGDLLRKYMALESYIPRYLPVRGELVMRETLASYAPAESRAFLMILNAVEELLEGATASPSPLAGEGGPGVSPGRMRGARLRPGAPSSVTASPCHLLPQGEKGRAPDPQAEEPATAAESLVAAWLKRAKAFAPSSGGLGEIETWLLDGLRRRLEPAQARFQTMLPALHRASPDGARMAASFATLAAHVRASWSDPPARRPAELFLELELALLLMEGWARLAEIELLVSDER